MKQTVIESNEEYTEIVDKILTQIDLLWIRLKKCYKNHKFAGDLNLIKIFLAVKDPKNFILIDRYDYLRFEHIISIVPYKEERNFYRKDQSRRVLIFKNNLHRNRMEIWAVKIDEYGTKRDSNRISNLKELQRLHRILGHYVKSMDPTLYLTCLDYKDLFELKNSPQLQI